MSKLTCSCADEIKQNFDCEERICEPVETNEH